ncbi:hypothetical protein K440DRAFT_638892 [Wilcoxina mikolae CBS 423.85]|nr:hypothetical protein K440DRAFT_638892 [Wilcoxina mikolae CBS 423.85]
MHSTQQILIQRQYLVISGFLLYLSAAVPAVRLGPIKYSAKFIENPSVQAECRKLLQTSIKKTRCYDYANCILANLSEYAKAGIASGTSILSLLPAAVALIPSKGPGVLTFSRFGLPLFLFAVFAGYITVGTATRDFIKIVGDAEDHETSKELINKVENIVTTPLKQGRNEERLFTKVKGSWVWVCFVVMAADVVILSYLALFIGFKTVVTWTCNHDTLILGWMVTRMTPSLFEWGFLRIATVILKRSGREVVPDAQQSNCKKTFTILSWLSLAALYNQTQGNPTASAQGEEALPIPKNLTRWLGAVYLTVRGLEGAILLYGTGVLGSTVMLDGAEAVIYLLIFPLLYALLHLCIILLV